AAQDEELPGFLTVELQINRKLSQQLNEQTHRINDIEQRKREISWRLLAESCAISNSFVFDFLAVTSAYPLAEAQYNLIQAEVTARKSKTNELEIAQLSANNRQEISRLRIKLFKKRYQLIDQELQLLRNHLNFQRQQKAQIALKHTEMLAAQDEELPGF
ncbi:MAG: miniconductance mechanosensitive channel MscM, partial [Arsenophonus sp. ER-EMS1-MAG3]